MNNRITKALTLSITSALLCLFGTLQLSAAELTHEQAFKALHAAQKKAEEQGTLMNIAVVDSGANLKAFIRMDGSYLGSIDVAIKKAKTARYFDTPTHNLGKLTQPGQPIYNIEHSNDGLITFGGGVPIKDKDGNVIGAIGVSGGTVENDIEVANSGANSVLKK
ncbi:GlcG/HbpS family heme-binding protein [Pelagicoccus mobilis]|uniref:Heme-binding protein n=1 Tax=Pelagicoccus mobilis TaxID=415221 RepID=A0A934VNG8_9BACT|nr:heme-binding protein [Pelagicoccus mobilis]MBK1876202.1 heme-binding protein [Pelagicoccus mobilis]